MSKTTTEMQLVAVSKLIPYVNNARTHSAEQIMKLRSSLREFGFINPVIIDREYNVIAGHGRILAAKEEGITEVPCVFVDYLTEAQKKAYILADNRMAMDAGWDEELLRIEIESLKDMDFNVGLTGFSEDELAELYGEDKQSEVEDDNYDLSDALEKAAFVQRGDIWTVGRHRLMCGDATSSEDVAALMDGKKANLIITDPPYNVAFESSDGLSIKNDKMANDKFYEFLLSAFKNMAEHLEKGGSAYVFHSPIAMAKNAIGLAIAAEEYGSKFYANGAAPSGVLEHPGTLKDPSKVRDSWSQTFGGSANSHKVAVLEEGMKYTPISISPNEAQFLETRKFQIDEIARIFRVPPHMVGDLEKSSFSNIEQQSLEFVKYTLDPWVSRWEQNMIRSLLSEEEKKKYFIKFNVDGLLRGDYQSRMNGYATARQNGWMSANDIRELENLDRIPAELGGDLYLINGNMTKLSDAGIFAASQDTSDRKEKTDEEQEVLELEEPKDSKPGKRGGHRTNP